MEIEKRPLVGKKKKGVKPQVIDVENGDRVVGDVVQTGISSSDADAPAGNECAAVIQPSAPEPEVEEPDGRRQLFRRLYLIMTAHVTFFTLLTVLFVFVPHLRNIMRRNVFDKLLLTSYIATPLLLVVVLYLLFPALRRRFAVIGVIVITATIGWLLSYVVSVQDARSMLISVGAADACSLTTYAGTFLSRLNVTSRKSLAYAPLFMVTSNAVFHSIFTRTSHAVIPAIVTSGLMTHFAFNARSLVQNESLNVQPQEKCFSLVQMYMSGAILQSAKRLFRRQSYTPI